MGGIRNRLRPLALLILAGFIVAAAYAPALACAKALASVSHVAVSSACDSCGGSDHPDHDTWSCAAPCIGQVVPVFETITVLRTPAEAAGISPQYRYTDWAAPPLTPPPRSA